MNQILKGAYEPRSSQFGDQLTVTVPGLVPAFFVGWTEPLTRFNRFDTCKTCKGLAADPPGNPACECQGTGFGKRRVIWAKYVTADGKEQREEMTYKLSSGGAGKSGRHYSPSTMYLRAQAFTGLTDEEQLAHYDWTDCRIPVQLLIKPNARGILQISDVLAVVENIFRDNQATEPPGIDEPLF